MALKYETRSYSSSGSVYKEPLKGKEIANPVKKIVYVNIDKSIFRFDYETAVRDMDFFYQNINSRVAKYISDDQEDVEEPDVHHDCCKSNCVTDKENK